MKYCWKCGTQLIDEAVFCVKCGAKQVETDADADAAFETKGGYKASAEQDTVGELESIKNLVIGDTVRFGTYWQETIEWIVLDIQDGKALLISKYGLDAKPYNVENTGVTWRTCTLRKWLNEDFLKQTFSAEEQARIQETFVTADRNPDYLTSPGNKTKNRIFLLSIPDAVKYFKTDKERRCTPTEYAKTQGAYTDDDYKTADGKVTCGWWLRSPGYTESDAVYAGCDGSIDSGGLVVSVGSCCIRPALWVDLEAVDTCAFDMAENVEKKNRGSEDWLIERELKVGGVVEFGRYPQTKEGNDQTPIEWQVLKIEDGKALLISKYGLDARPYHTCNGDATWDTCTLRKWLNRSFLKRAFDMEEQEELQEMYVQATRNPDYSTNFGKETKDKIFLLGIFDAKEYFKSDEDRRCVLTEYARAQGAYSDNDYKTADGKAACLWWLRAPGVNGSYAAYVQADGNVNTFGCHFGSNKYCVRPALWVNLEC